MGRRPSQGLKEKIHEIIFEADTPWGKFFDISLLVIIILSILVVMLETVEPLNTEYGKLFTALEWVFTIIFTIEYFLRLYCVYSPIRYATSFFGIVDLLAIIPTYLRFFFAGTQYLLVIRALRLLRVFRIFKLGHFLKEGRIIAEALKASRIKIMVFLFAVLVLVVIIGSIMYLIEGGNKDTSFSSIPRAIYWAIVTLTTVGYGDITPQTPVGQFFSAVVMILGYAIIAVPTGIVSAELVQAHYREEDTICCKFCSREGHDKDAQFCKYCGNEL